MEFFKAISLERARQIVCADLPSLLFKAEILPLCDCLGKRIASNLTANRAHPGFRRSCVDGYALHSTDASGANESVPALLCLKGSIKMGEKTDVVCKNGECCYVPTGGGIPDECNSVVMIEHTTTFSDKIAVLRPVAVGENIVNVGDDVKIGDVLATAGTLVTPLLLGQLAMVGITHLNVYPSVRASIISTGDELRALGQVCGDGQITDINGIVIEGFLKQINAKIVRRILLKDDYCAIKSALQQCAEDSDVVFVSGGSSVGQKDYTLNLLKELSNLRFNGVSIKPGKPSMFAANKSCVFFGLPGNPMAATVAYKVLFEEPLLKAYGATNFLRILSAKAAINFPGAPGKTTIQPVTLSKQEDGYYATPIFYRSALISKLAKADGYVMLDEKTEGVNKNEEMQVILL